MVERPWSAGGQPRRFFRIPGRREDDHEKERAEWVKEEDSCRREWIPFEATGELKVNQKVKDEGRN